jgi:hypothetical protein
MSAKHSVYVLDVNGEPLMPTTPSKARKLLKGGVAKKKWNKFGTFGIQMIVDTRKEKQDCALGIDHGTKFEGYSVVCDKENNFNLKLDLPDKKRISKKLEERRRLRRTRRQQKCRRREARFNNRKRDGFIAPSQMVMVNSRLKVLKEIFKIYPINYCGFEDVCFNHAKHKWGKNFSTIEIGKTKLKEYIKSFGIELFEYKGWETKELREKYDYKKISNKAKDCFEAHNCDSLSLAVNIVHGDRVEPNNTLYVMDDTYRPVRRKLFDTQFKNGGVKDKYSTGVIDSIRKGIIVGFNNGRNGKLVGQTGNSYYFKKEKSNRLSSIKKNLNFISSNFIMKEVVVIPPVPKGTGFLATT